MNKWKMEEFAITVDSCRRNQKIIRREAGCVCPGCGGLHRAVEILSWIAEGYEQGCGCIGWNGNVLLAAELVIGYIDTFCMQMLPKELNCDLRILIIYSHPIEEGQTPIKCPFPIPIFPKKNNLIPFVYTHQAYVPCG